MDKVDSRKGDPSGLKSVVDLDTQRKKVHAGKRIHYMYAKNNRDQREPKDGLSMEETWSLMGPGDYIQGSFKAESYTESENNPGKVGR